MLDSTTFKGFGNRLKIAIKNSKQTQRDLAFMVGISEDTFLNYTKERSYPPADVLFKLCSILGVSADWLLFGKEDTPTNNQEQELLSSFRLLKKPDQSDIALFAKIKAGRLNHVQAADRVNR